MYVSCKWQYHFILYLVDSTVLDAVQYSCIQEETPHSSDTNDTSTNVSIATYRNKSNIHCQNKFLQKPVCARLLLVDGWMLKVKWDEFPLIWWLVQAFRQYMIMEVNSWHRDGPDIFITKSELAYKIDSGIFVWYCISRTRSWYSPNSQLGLLVYLNRGVKPLVGVLA